MNFTIVNIAYPFAPVRPDTPGGAEQILRYIESGLSKQRIRSLCIANEKSEITGTLIPIPDMKKCIGADAKKITYLKVKECIRKVLKDEKPDLIHYHGVDFYEYDIDTDIKKLVTLHLPITYYDMSKLQKIEAFYNCVSKNQYQVFQNQVKNLYCIINGVDIPVQINRKINPSFALCIGRICPEKGNHLALTAAKKAGIPLIMAGEVFNYQEHVEYYEQMIKPYLDYINYRFIGRIGPVQKDYLYNNAKCVLIPSLVDETSSLVAMEAISHGTPVIAFNRGALSEIVKNGETGYLVKNEYEMANAINYVNKISPQRSFNLAREYFDKKRMVSEYIDLYSDIIKKGAFCNFFENKIN